MKYFLSCFVLAGGLFLGWCFYREYIKINSITVTSWTQDHRADCAVVLTGSVGRVREGFDVLARKQVKKLIISGVHLGAELSLIFPHWSFYGELKEEDVILEKQSGTTYGNARQTLAITQALGCRDIILITSRLHTERAYQTFVSVFPPNYPIYKRSVLSGSYHLNFWDVVIETSKSVFYSLWVY